MTTPTQVSERPSWDQTWLGVVNVVKLRAACTRRQVAAIIVVANRHIVGLGYNGVPSGETHCTDGGCPRGLLTAEDCAPLSAYDNCKALHAEMNAATRAGDRARGATMYITCEPCDWCQKICRSAGIARIVWPDGEIVIHEQPIAA
jgi:dCMP deaminase